MERKIFICISNAVQMIYFQVSSLQKMRSENIMAIEFTFKSYFKYLQPNKCCNCALQKMYMNVTY